MSTKKATVIGLGAMGQAIAGGLVSHGHEVTMWNRTPGKGDGLVAEGASLVATVEEALAAGELALVSLTDYDAMYSILADAPDALDGRVLVNLSSGTPKQARAAATWAAERGARLLAGGVRVPPSGIGTPDAQTFYSGDRATFEAHSATLQALTATDYRGADPGLAMLHYQLEEDLLWTTMIGFLHALAVADANGLSAKDFLPYATRTMSSVQELIAFFAPRIDANEFTGDLDRLATGLAGIDHVVHTTREAGVDATVPLALREIFGRGMAEGYADDSASSLFKVLRRA